MDALHSALWRLARLAAASHDDESFAMAEKALGCLPGSSSAIDGLESENKRLAEMCNSLQTRGDEWLKDRCNLLAENKRLKSMLSWALTYVEAADEDTGLVPSEQSVYCSARAAVMGR